MDVFYWGLVSSEGGVEGECFLNRVLSRLNGTPLNAVLLQSTGGLDRRLIQRGGFCKRSLVAPKGVLGTCNYWMRFEWQHHGSPHVHGVAWL